MTLNYLIIRRIKTGNVYTKTPDWGPYPEVYHIVFYSKEIMSGLFIQDL